MVDAERIPDPVECPITEPTTVRCIVYGTGSDTTGDLANIRATAERAVAEDQT